MKIWKLVSGILSMVIFFITIYQSFATGFLNAFENNVKDISTAGGFVISILFLAAGIVSTSLWKEESKGGDIALIILFGLAAFFGFTNDGKFYDLIIWSSWASICFVMAIIAFQNDSLEEVNKREQSYGNANSIDQFQYQEMQSSPQTVHIRQQRNNYVSTNVKKREITIGRSTSCDISLGESAEFASTYHGTIFGNGTQLMYKDTSTNGTVINNTMVHLKTVPINRGDTILIAGKYQIRWEWIDSLLAPSKMSYQPTRLLKLNTVTSCRKCGTKLNEGAKFCPKCGTPCNSSYSQSAGESGVVGQNKSSKVPIKALLSVIIVIALMVGGGYFLKTNITQTAKELVSSDNINMTKVSVIDEETDVNPETKDNNTSDSHKNIYSANITDFPWLQGHWVYDVDISINTRYRINVIIEDNRITQYRDDHIKSFKPIYTIGDGKIIVLYEPGVITSYTIDSERQVISVDDFENGKRWMYKIGSDEEIRHRAGFETEDTFFTKIANQLFRSRDGNEIRFDENRKVYINGVYAGTLEIESLEKTAAVVRYSGGECEEGKLHIDTNLMTRNFLAVTKIPYDNFYDQVRN